MQQGAGDFYYGVLVQGAKSDAKYNHVNAPETILNKVRKMQAVCEQYGVPLPAVALQFPLQHPAVASTVTGFRSPSQVIDCVGWKEQPITSAVIETFKKEGFIEAQ